MKTKLTMISVTFRGRRTVMFVQAPVDDKGKTWVSYDLMHDTAAALGARTGDTFTSG